VPKCTPDSLEISVIKIESLKGLNQLKTRTKKYYNYSNYTSITYTTLGHFYRPNRWHSAGRTAEIKIISKEIWVMVLNARFVISQGTTRPTASNGFESSGEFETCEEFTVAKAGRKNIRKNRSDSSNTPGELIYIGISSEVKAVWVKFEISSLRAPQRRNGTLKRMFQTLYGRIHSMLNGATTSIER
jgi:hypothetical protein